MSSSAKSSRVIRSAREDAEIYVMGAATARPSVVPPAVLADADALRAAARAEADAIVAAARTEAAQIVADARSQAASIRDAAFAEGLVEGRASSEQELMAAVEIARTAANEGKQIRDALAGQSAAVVARATSLATRRVVAEYYQQDPERTAAVVADALQAAAGQQILTIRVHPTLVGPLQVRLSDASRYLSPDEGVAIGGCIVDLAHGRIDATLDARLSLMDFALGAAGGEVDE